MFWNDRADWPNKLWDITVEDGQKIKKIFRVNTEQQFLDFMFCMYLKWPWLLRFFGKML